MMRFSPVMAVAALRRALPVSGALLSMTLAVHGASAEDAFPVPELPSGLKVELQEMFLDVKPDGLLTYARFRFVAPGIVGEGAPDFEARLKDMDVLCNDFAMPHVEETPDQVDIILISLADRAIEFGIADPETTQFFESYSIENGACIWGDF